MTELILVRHADPDETARGRCYGTLDVGLSDRGRAQCAALADRLAGVDPDRVISSPRRRAIETATAISARVELEPVVLEPLRELDFGDLEGRTYEEIAASLPDLFAAWMNAPTTVRFPGGEGYDDLRERVTRCVAEIRAQAGEEETIVVVTHGGVVRCVAADVLGMPADRIFRLAVDTASLTRIRWIADEPVLVALNERVA